MAHHDDQQSATDKERADSRGKQHETGVIDGVGGVGGSSGAGGLRSSSSELGSVSGIDPEIDESEIPAPGSTGKAGPSNARNQQMSDGGLPGKTRSQDSETVPNQEPADSPDSR